MKIIPATPEHVPVIGPLFDQYRVFYKQPSNLTASTQFIQERLTHKESIIFLALSDAATPIGLGFTQLYPSFSSESLKRLWILNDLYVSPAARKQGVGEALMERASQFAKDDHAKGLSLETAMNNFPAQRLYERIGWKRDEEFYRYNLIF